MKRKSQRNELIPLVRRTPNKVTNILEVTNIIIHNVFTKVAGHVMMTIAITFPVICNCVLFLYTTGIAIMRCIGQLISYFPVRVSCLFIEIFGIGNTNSTITHRIRSVVGFIR